MLYFWVFSYLFVNHSHYRCCLLCDLYSSSLQMLLPILEHTLAKEMVQLFWMMWPVLEMRADLWTVNTLPIITVSTVKMLESVAKLNVSSNDLPTRFINWFIYGTNYACIIILIGCTYTRDALLQREEGMQLCELQIYSLTCS